MAGKHFLILFSTETSLDQRKKEEGKQKGNIWGIYSDTHLAEDSFLFFFNF